MSPPGDRGPRIVHVDDVPWQEVRRQQHGPDPVRTASVYERWLDTQGGFLSLHARWDPGMMVQPHGHNSDHVVFVLEGSMTCGGVSVGRVRTSRSTRATTSAPSSLVRRVSSSSR